MKLKGSVIVIILFFSIMFLSPSTSNGMDLPEDRIKTQAIGYDGYIVPISFIADYYFYQLRGSNTLNYINETLQEVNELYYNSSIPIHFELDHVEVFEDQTQNDLEFDYTETGFGVSANDLLNSVTSYINSNSTLDTSEIVQFVSGLDFVNSTIGLAWLGEIDNNTPLHSIVQFTYDKLDFDAALSAHEIGHNLGSEHDPYNESDPNCEDVDIMNVCINFNFPPTEFSDSSITEITNYLTDSRFDGFVDNIIPELDDILDFSVEKEIGEIYTLTWNITEENPGYFDLYVDSVHVEQFQQINSNQILYSFSLDEIAFINVTVVISDLVGHVASDGVLIDITGDPNPQISEVEDVVVLENETITLTWNLSDNGNSSYVEFFENSVLLYSFNFTQSYLLNHTISNNSPGEYNYTILVIDEFNQNISTTTLVTVEEVSDPPEDTNTIPSESSSLNDQDDTSTNGDAPSLFDSLSFNFVSVLISFSFLISVQILRSKSRQK